jgi:hypothetical protein
MTPATATRSKAPSWTCAGCAVTISWVPGREQRGFPSGWAKLGGQPYCLRCRREHAAQSAIDNAPPEVSREERAKLRAAAVLEFELVRDPDRPNGEIAKVVRCSVPAVLKSRRRLEDARA